MPTGTAVAHCSRGSAGWVAPKNRSRPQSAAPARGRQPSSRRHLAPAGQALTAARAPTPGGSDTPACCRVRPGRHRKSCWRRRGGSGRPARAAAPPGTGCRGCRSRGRSAAAAPAADGRRPCRSRCCSASSAAAVAAVDAAAVAVAVRHRLSRPGLRRGRPHPRLQTVAQRQSPAAALPQTAALLHRASRQPTQRVCTTVSRTQRMQSIQAQHMC